MGERSGVEWSGAILIYELEMSDVPLGRVWIGEEHRYDTELSQRSGRHDPWRTKLENKDVGKPL
jgi:hypothetical protein